MDGTTKGSKTVARYLFLIVSLCASGMLGAESVAEIDVTSAAQLIQDKKVRVLDVREPSEYAAGHIAGSTLIPVGQVNSRFEELIAHKDEPMLVVCGSGGRSAKAIEILNKHGFSQLRNIKGGMSAWRKANLPVVQP
jgi:rhodanese-related sulfurtransferase